MVFQENLRTYGSLAKDKAIIFGSECGQNPNPGLFFISCYIVRNGDLRDFPPLHLNVLNWFVSEQSSAEFIYDKS